jgi:hypothetical protein
MIQTAATIAYAVAGVATFIAFIVWTMAQLPARPDWVDGMFGACLGVAIGVIWPVAWLGVAVMVFGRRVWTASQPSPD